MSKEEKKETVFELSEAIALLMLKQIKSKLENGDNLTEAEEKVAMQILMKN